nr:hypothetical protein MFLOJ_20300 [Mycobacterium florentinum]
MGRADERAPHVGRQSGDATGERTPADAVATLEDHYVVALSRQLSRRGKAGKAGADHHNIDSPRRLCHAL